MLTDAPMEPPTPVLAPMPTATLTFRRSSESTSCQRRSARHLAVASGNRFLRRSSALDVGSDRSFDGIQGAGTRTREGQTERARSLPARADAGGVIAQIVVPDAAVRSSPPAEVRVESFE